MNNNNYNTIIKLIYDKTIINNDQVLFSLKDNLITSLSPNSAGSCLLKNSFMNYDSDVYSILKEKYTLYSKDNMDVFGCGSYTTTSCYGPVKYYKPVGGSSGGTALNVALGYVSFGLGSDTGGSVHSPAILCNVFGYKPTKECISRYGLIQFSTTLDSVGILIKQNKLDLLRELMLMLNVKGRNIEYRPFEHSNLESEIITYDQFYKLLPLEYDIVDLYETIAYSELVSSLQRYKTYKYSESFEKLEPRVKKRWNKGMEYIKSGEYEKKMKEIEKIRKVNIDKIYILPIDRDTTKGSPEDSHYDSVAMYMNMYNLPRFTFKLNELYHMAFGPRYFDISILDHLIEKYKINEQC